MSALTNGRNTKFRNRDRRNFAIAASATIYAGALVALNATGFLVPASTATTLTCVGRAEAYVDNSDGADGDLKVDVGAGVYLFANSAAADLIANTDIGADCYAVDDQTVAKTDGTGTRSVAGKIFDVDADGVWVQF